MNTVLLIDWHKMSLDWGMIYQLGKCTLSMLLVWNCFPKQYRHITNDLHLYLTNYPLTAYLCALFLFQYFSNTTFTSMVIFGHISSGPMHLFLYIYKRCTCVYNVQYTVYSTPLNMYCSLSAVNHWFLPQGLLAIG